MSESEKKRRLEYRKRRRTLILLQTIIAILVGVATVVSSVVYFRADSSYNVSYVEQCAIDYKVYLKPNNEYEEEYLGEGQSYIATLIDHVDITYDYVIDLDTESANYSGTYYVDAVLNITDNSNKKVIFTHTYPVKAKTVFDNSGSNKLKISDSVTIGYDEYNNFANNFKEVYGLSDVTCNLNVVMNVEANGKSESFESYDFGKCSFSLNIPLTKKTIEINMLSSIPGSEQSIITCEDCFNKTLYKYIALYGFILDAVILIVLFTFAYVTRNHDINYEIKIKRLVSAYKPYIQKILNEFNKDGYRVLEIGTFNEMLDIRDTISSPILMSENADKTCTTFLIPTDNNILYMHQIKVEDYDEIYGITNNIVEEIPETEVQEEVVATEEAVEEIVVTEEPIIVEEQIEEPVVEADVEEEIISEEELDELDEQGFKNGPRYNYSFLAKLHLSSEHTREFYQEISNFIQSYGLKVNRSWSKERVRLGRKTYAILAFKGLKLTVSFALNPNDYEDTKYKLIDVSEIKKFAQTPAQMKVTSFRKVNWVKELFIEMLSKDGIESKNLSVETPKIRPKTKAKLIKEELIKVVFYNETNDLVDDDIEPIIEEQKVATPAIEVVEEQNFNRGPSYSYSFLAKLHLSSEHTREFYQEIYNFIASYGLKVNRSWGKERIQHGRKTYAILSFRGLKLAVSFAINPNDYLDTKYKLIDVSETKKFAQTPAQMKITSLRKVNWVKELFIDMLTKDGVENKNLNVQAPKVRAKTKTKLIKENLIKVK